MTADDGLVFSWTCWPATRLLHEQRVPSIAGVVRGWPMDIQSEGRVVRDRRLWSKHVPDGRGAARPEDPAPIPCTIFSVGVSGAGRYWAATEPEGFWRSFSEIDFVYGDGSDVLRFMQRHGEPFGTLDAHRRTTDTIDWVAPVLDLHQVASAWDAPTANGLSYLTKEPGRLRQAREVLQTRLLPANTSAFDVVSIGSDLVKRALNLQAFMTASAASALRRGMPMRQCQHCKDWFEARRRDMRFCSASCRAAYATAQKGI